MKKNYLFLMCMILTAVMHHTSIAQIGKGNAQTVQLGNSKGFVKNLTQNLTSTKQIGAPSQLSLKVSDTKTFKGIVNLHQSEQQGSEILVGELANVPGSSFFINHSEQGLRGNIILKNTKQAYKYYSDNKGNAYVKEISIDSLLCVDYDKAEKPQLEELSQQGAASTSSAYNLQSLPGANGVVLLDFDGHYVSGTPWNNGYPINAQPSNMSAAAIQEAWEIVAEDFRPFNINITTSEAVFNSYPKNRRMRCIITPTNTAAPGAGGVAYLNSFAWNDDTPCWTFNTYAKGAGETSSHEIGHTLGLSHDGRTSPSEAYYSGHGSWAPIMGVGYNRSIVHWSKGEYAYANNREDDLARIAGSSNGVGYRADDHGNSTAAATALKLDAAGNLTTQNTGLIERNTDVDFFSFSTGGGNVTLNFSPAARHANLDILVKLYNSAGTVLGTYNPTSLSSAINTNLAAGKYFISVDGTGAGSQTTGYTDYASLGYYSISGKIPAGGGTGNQSPTVAITSPANNATFAAPASITINANASDSDGTIGKVEFYNGSVKLGEDTTAPYSFAWANVAAGSYSLRAVATDNKGAATTSATVAITVGQVTACGVPTGLAVSNVTANAATLTWAAQSGASSYEVWWRVPGGNWIGGVSTAKNSVTATGLQSGTQYQIAVSAYCSGNQTDYAYASFTTNTNRSGVATVYQNCNYGGYAVQLAPGNYTTAQLSALGIRDNDISSLKVAAGYEAILYRYNNYQGGGYIFRYDYSCLSYTNFDNTTSSIVVRASTATRYASAQAAALAEGAAPIVIDAEPVVAPNPSAGEVSVMFNTPDAANAEVQIFDALGKKAAAFSNVTPGQKLNISALPSGLYIFRITIGNETFTKKVVKE